MKGFFTWLIPSLLFLSLFTIPNLVNSQTLYDFQQGSQYKGVDCIPFSSLRGDAASIQKEIEYWKQEAASFPNADEFERKKSKDYKAIQQENEVIKKKQAYIDDLKSRGTSTDQFEKDLEPNLQNVKGFNDDIIKINDQINKAIETWDRLERLRGGMREKFNDVLYKLDNAKSSPNQYLGSNPTDFDRNKLIGYINTIIGVIKDAVPGHEQAEKDAYKVVEKMKEVLRKSDE